MLRIYNIKRRKEKKCEGMTARINEQMIYKPNNYLIQKRNKIL